MSQARGKSKDSTDDPSVNDVLAQQLGTGYADVEPADKEEIQKRLKDQA